MMTTWPCQGMLRHTLQGSLLHCKLTNLEKSPAEKRQQASVKRTHQKTNGYLEAFKLITRKASSPSILESDVIFHSQCQFVRSKTCHAGNIARTDAEQRRERILSCELRAPLEDYQCSLYPVLSISCAPLEDYQCYPYPVLSNLCERRWGNLIAAWNYLSEKKKTNIIRPQKTPYIRSLPFPH